MSSPNLHWTVNPSGEQAGTETSVRDLARHEMKVAFQPIVDMDTGGTFALEALARCQKPGLESPLVLFTKASEQRASGRLGRLIREVAFSECANMPLFVNIHPEELSERWLIRPDDPLGFHAQPVFLEITEAAAFTHFDLCTSVLKELCTRTGVNLVVDDFGAGYSNIQRILDLEPAVVKLDLALIRNIHHKPRQRAVVRHMVALCEDLGCSVVAEGIEVLEELHVLRDLGVHYGQGYLLAKPAFSPPEVRWPAGMPPSPKSAQRTPPGPRVGPRPTVPDLPTQPPRGSGRVLVEEVVLVSPARPAARKLRPSKPPSVRASKTPTVRPGKAPSRRPGRKSKAPPR